MAFFDGGVEVGSGGVTGITYTTGSASVGANTDYYVYAPNPGAVMGQISTNTQVKFARNGASINLRNTDNSNSKTAVWLKIGHTTG